MTQDRPEVDAAIVEVEDELSMLFTRAKTVWRDAAAKLHPELQPVGYKILATIARAGETNAHFLAEQLEVDKSVISRQVRVLEEIGFVVSRVDERDGRARVLVATPLAQERVNALRTENQARLRGVLSTRSPEELKAFAEMLRLLGTA